MNEGTDNSVVDTTASTDMDTDLDNQTVETDAPDTGDTEATQDQEAQAQVTPFASGKEKLTINGQEVELSWDEVKKYASLGRTAYDKMQEAASIRKQVQDNYKKLVQLAQTNPQGLIEVLTGRKAPSAGQSQAQDEQGDQIEARRNDPRDAEIQELKAKIEARELAEERKAIETELTSAVSKYPELNNEIYKEYVKSQYAKALRQGADDITIEDVAFIVSQQVKEKQAQSVRERQQKIKERRDRAPVTVPPGHRSDKPKEMDLEAVKRLAGRM